VTKGNPRIELISRKPGRFNSIEKVFTTLLPHLALDGKVSSRRLKFGGGLVGIILNLMLFRPGKADIHHITGESHFLCLKLPTDKTILTIHDLRFLERRKGIRGYLIRKLFLEWPLQKLRWITAVSNATKDHIEKEFPSAVGRVRVIPNPVTSPEHESTEGTISMPRKRRILQVGTESHKNLQKVIEAIAGKDFELVILGHLTEKDLRLLRDHRIVFRNHVFLSDSDLRKAYIDSDVLVFCSLFEGFGLPILEAQSLGIPVVTSDIAVLRETAGDGALFADSNNAEDIYDKLAVVLENDSLRDSLISKGYENILRFSPERIGAMYRELYSDIMDSRTVAK
jgi:glycosyltransferase involved in cell wall biosynthesis